jgi:hypothetical protein
MSSGEKGLFLDRLSHSLADKLRKGTVSLSRDLHTEQDYQRNCERMFELDSFGRAGDLVSQAEAHSHFERLANSGHADADTASSSWLGLGALRITSETPPSLVMTGP